MTDSYILFSMVYIRGHKEDYNRWAELTGSDQFKYENVLPYFKRSQDAVNYGDDEYCGRNGFLKTTKQVR